MGNFEFLTYMMLPNIFLYIILLIFSFGAFFPIIKKHANSIIDPMFFCLIIVAFADVVPFFLYILNECSLKNIVYFIISECLFWGAFLYFSNLKVRFAPTEFKNERKILSKLFWFSVFVYFSSKIYTWIYVGIPLFMTTRLELYRDAAPGAGILTKLGSISSVFLIYYVFYKIFECKKKRYAIFLVFVIVDLFLSGSKVGILSLFFSYFNYSFFYKGLTPKFQKKYIPLILLFPSLVIIIGSGSEYGEGLFEGFLSTLFRLAAYGDVYWYAYPNEIIDSINYKTPVLQFFSGLLGPLRILSWEHTEMPIGIKLYWALIGSDEGVFGGPNARVPVATWVFFKWGGLFISSFLGILMAKTIYGIRRFIPQSLLGVIIYSFFYSAALTIPTDVSIFFDRLITIVLFFMTYGIWYLISNNFKIIFVRKL